MIPTISASTLKQWLHDGAEIALLDVREHGQYGESHLFYATPLPYSRLEIDAPRLVPRLAVRLVVYDDGQPNGVAARTAARLRDMGYNDVQVLAGGTAAWQQAGYALFAGVNLPSKTFGELVEHIYGTPHITADALAEMLARGEPVVVLDGRPMAEFRKMSIPSATCCPNGELPYRIGALVPDAHTPVVVNCAGRTRSIIGAQTLINLGLPNPVFALQNGTQGWYLDDHALEHGRAQRYADDSGSSALAPQAEAWARAQGVRWVDAATVREWAAQPDRTLFLCDVRTQEEFAARTLPGARHTPGGQLVQAADQFIGVRGARIVLFDSDGARAPSIAAWLRQMGHDASVLQDGLESGLVLDVVLPPEPPALAPVDAPALLEEIARGTSAVIDLRSSMAFRAGHIPTARWSIRPHLAEALVDETRPVVLVADDPAVAAWAVASELPTVRPAPRLLQGGMQAWIDAGGALDVTPGQPADAECIDYLFFVHDRHDGNKAAARRYLEWETGLLARLDAQERAAFRLPETAPTSA